MFYENHNFLSELFLPNCKVDFECAYVGNVLFLGQGVLFTFTALSFKKCYAELRSSNHHRLFIPRYKTNIGCWSFSVAEPVWNSFPDHVKSANTVIWRFTVTSKHTHFICLILLGDLVYPSTCGRLGILNLV